MSKIDTLNNVVVSAVLLSHLLTIEETMRELPSDVEDVIGRNVHAIRNAIIKYQKQEVEALKL